MVRVHVSANASKHLLEIANFLGPSLAGESFMARFEAATELLAEFPEAGRRDHPRNQRFRYLIVRDYLVNYEITVDGVVIRSIIHGARVKRRRR